MTRRSIQRVSGLRALALGLSMLGLLASAPVLTSCEKTAGESLDDAVEKVKDGTNEAVEKTKDAVNDVKDKIDDAVSD